VTCPFQPTLRWATEADFDTLADVMFAAVREGESPYTEAQRQAWVPEPRRGSEWRTRLLSQDIIVAEADGRLLGFMSLAEGGGSLPTSEPKRRAQVCFASCSSAS
jgi:putative acetyltransferase